MSAAGPDLRHVVLGSEGTPGIITSVRVAVRPAPIVREYETWRMDTFADGADAIRALVQDGINPTVLRLSDEPETALNLATPGDVGLSDRSGAVQVCG